MDRLLDFYKKKRPPKDAKKEYNSAWLRLVQQDGFTEQARGFLLDGARHGFPVHEAFSQFWDRKGRPKKLVQQLIDGSSKRTGQARSRHLVLQLRILAMLLNRGAPPEQVALLVSSTGTLIRKPDGAYTFRADAKVREDLIGLTEPGAAFPSFETLPLSQTARNGFTRMLTELTGSTVSNKWTSSRLLVRRMMLEWIGAEPAADSRPEIAAPGTAPAAAVPDGSRSAELSAAVTALKKLVPYVRGLEQQVAEYETTFDNLKKRAGGANVAALQARNEELEQQLADRTALIDVIERDKMAIAEDRRAKLEEGLAREYDDFESAENFRMSLILGENIRDQLRSVFAMLREFGLRF